VYYISRTGVTGAGFEGVTGGDDRVAIIQKATGAPVCVGFGIKTAADVKRVAEKADGVVVGSAAVQRVADAKDKQDAARSVGAFVKELRGALR
jgi:tryptophan synthase alpha chain